MFAADMLVDGTTASLQPTGDTAILLIDVAPAPVLALPVPVIGGIASFGLTLPPPAYFANVAAL